MQSSSRRSPSVSFSRRQEKITSAGVTGLLLYRDGGFLQIESAPAALRRTVDPFDTAERALVASLKREFDPRRTLNRGRWQEDA